MTDITAATVFYGVIFGALGGVLYIVYNHLVSVATYLTATEHVVAGAIVGVLGVTALGYADPSVVGITWATTFPLVVLGYFGVDVIDGIAADIANEPVPTPPAST